MTGSGGVRGDSGAGQVGGDPPVPDEIDLTGFDAADLAALGAIDRALDRLAARRSTAADLDDPAFAALAVLAEDVDVDPVPAEQARGSRRVVRLRGLAVAACTVIALYAVGAVATGSWAPWLPADTGQVSAADADDLRAVLASGLRSVDADDVVSARAGLEHAVALLSTAELTTQERAQVEVLLTQLAQALSDEGVPLDGVTLPPGVSSPTSTSLPTSGAASLGAGTASDMTASPQDNGNGKGTGRPSDVGRPGTATDTATDTETDTATDTETTTSTVTTNPGGQTGKPSDVGNGTTKTKKPKKTKTTTDDA